MKCGELKAVLFAGLSCFLFIGFLAVVSQRTSRNERRVTKIRASPPAQPGTPVPPVRVTEPPKPPDANSKFRNVPPNFLQINFGTRSYGNYELSNGVNRDLVLIDGKFREVVNSHHWFDLDDVYYTDLTGDGSPEAIVMMTHLECGRQCDGGKNLVYVYSQDYPREYPMNEIFKYESGSGLDGCSLKSLNVKNKQLTLELFGRCPQPAGTSHEFVRRETYDVTRLEYFFNGKELVQKKKTFLTVPDHNELSYGVDVHIEDRSAVTQKF